VRWVSTNDPLVLGCGRRDAVRTGSFRELGRGSADQYRSEGAAPRSSPLGRWCRCGACGSPSRPRRGAGPGSPSATGGGRDAAGTHIPNLVLCGHHVGFPEVERHVRKPPQSRTAQRQAADGLIRAGRPGMDLTAGLADAVGADPLTRCRDRCGQRTSHSRKVPALPAFTPPLIIRTGGYLPGRCDLQRLRTPTAWRYRERCSPRPSGRHSRCPRRRQRPYRAGHGNPATVALFTNADVLAVHPASSGNREVLREGPLILWAADGPAGQRYAAAFNLGATPLPVALDAADLGLPSRLAGEVHQLWTGAGEHASRRKAVRPGAWSDSWQHLPAPDPAAPRCGTPEVRRLALKEHNVHLPITACA
jgi:hypothetical protein